MTELNQQEIDDVSGGRGLLWDYYSDIMAIHADLVDRLSSWAARTWP